MKIEQLGPYRVVRLLGRGGMGTVYEAFHVETGEPAAIKILAAAIAQEEGFRARFEAEIETLRKLNHPSIVRLYGFGEQNERMFYAMELVAGTSLDDQLRQGRTFRWDEVVHIAACVARALRHAHDRGVVHRDLKPANLLMAVDGQVKLSDFGIARLFGHSRHTTAGSVLGTAEYMAPEQAAGRPVDARADLYSLGAVMYALLCGRPPFAATSLTEMLDKQRFAIPDPVGKHAPHTPGELQSVVSQLLEKSPDSRTPTAAVLLRRLESLPAAPPIDGLSPPTGGGTVVRDGALPDAPLKPPEATAVVPPASLAGRPTRGNDPGAELPPDSPTAEYTAFPPPDPQEELPDTKATSAFDGYRLAGEDAPAGERPASAPADNKTAPNVRRVATDVMNKTKLPPARTRGGEAASTRFTVVTDADRDPVQEAEPQPVALVSLQVIVLSAALLAVGLLAWYFLQPPSANALYDAVQSRASEGSIDNLLDAERDIDQFLERYANDPRAAQIRGYQRDIQLFRLERKFERRAAGLVRNESLLPIERVYLEALQEARVHPERCIERLQSLVDLYAYHADPHGPAGQCLELARRRLERLREQLQRRASEETAIVEARLAVATHIANQDPDQARRICQAVIDLYASQAWATALVAQARKVLADVSRSAATASPARTDASPAVSKSSLPSGKKPAP